MLASFRTVVSLVAAILTFYTFFTPESPLLLPYFRPPILLCYSHSP